MEPTFKSSSGEPGVGVGGTYSFTLNPKKSWPNGRLSAAGTLTVDSSMSLFTMWCLLGQRQDQGRATSNKMDTYSVRIILLPSETFSIFLWLTPFPLVFLPFNVSPFPLKLSQ